VGEGVGGGLQGRRNSDDEGDFQAFKEPFPLQLGGQAAAILLRGQEDRRKGGRKGSTGGVEGLFFEAWYKKTALVKEMEGGDAGRGLKLQQRQGKAQKRISLMDS